MSLRAVAELLTGDAPIVKGVCQSESDGLRVYEKYYSDKPYCLVKKWSLIELDVDQEDLEMIEQAGSQPILLYSSHVLYDSLDRFDKGNWVRSTLMVRFIDECLFETQNTVYILIGDGKRKNADPSVVMSIF